MGVGFLVERGSLQKFLFRKPSSSAPGLTTAAVPVRVFFEGCQRKRPVFLGAFQGRFLSSCVNQRCQTTETHGISRRGFSGAQRAGVSQTVAAARSGHEAFFYASEAESGLASCAAVHSSSCEAPDFSFAERAIEGRLDASVGGLVSEEECATCLWGLLEMLQRGFRPKESLTLRLLDAVVSFLKGVSSREFDFQRGQSKALLAFAALQAAVEAGVPSLPAPLFDSLVHLLLQLEPCLSACEEAAPAEVGRDSPFEKFRQMPQLFALYEKEGVLSPPRAGAAALHLLLLTRGAEETVDEDEQCVEASSFKERQQTDAFLRRSQATRLFVRLLLQGRKQVVSSHRAGMEELRSSAVSFFPLCL